MSLVDLRSSVPDVGMSDDLGRTPPQDLAAEQSVLGGMMLSKDAIADVVEVLRGTDFYRPAHELVFEAILDLYGRGEPADAVTVADELVKRGELGRIGGAAYLHTLLSCVPTAANASYYARIVHERAVLRRLVQAGTKIVQLGYAAQGGDVDEIVNAAQAEVYAVTERRQSEDYLKISEIMEATIDEIEASTHRGDGLVGVPTGFTELDRLTNGLHAGQMIVIAARPAVGKALALDTPIPTPTGWTTMGALSTGQHVLGSDGRPTLVTAVTQVMTGRDCFEVEFSDGEVLVADAEHQWTTTATDPDLPLPRTAVRTTSEIADSVKSPDGTEPFNHLLPAVAPLAQAVRAVLPGAVEPGDRPRYITAVRLVASVPVRCIQVASPDRLYLAGRRLVPTHNSTVGLDIARSASIKNQLPAVIFSLEMSRTEIAMRMLSAEAQIPLHTMRRGALHEEDWTRLARTMGRVNEAPLFIDDSPNMSLMEIRAKCRRLKQRNGLRLVVVDYLQLMTSGKRVESRQQEVSEFSRALKLLAKELEVPVIAISQLNRGPEQRTDKKPMLSDLRESGSIEQDADMVILLHREDMYEKESPRAGEADFIVAKHRNGPTDTITVAFQGHYSRFTNMPS